MTDRLEGCEMCENGEPCIHCLGAEVERLQERLGDREQDLKILGKQLEVAVDALRRITADDCMLTHGETGGWIDTDAPGRIAQDALDDLGPVERGGLLSSRPIPVIASPGCRIVRPKGE